MARRMRRLLYCCTILNMANLISLTNCIVLSGCYTDLKLSQLIWSVARGRDNDEMVRLIVWRILYWGMSRLLIEGCPGSLQVLWQFWNFCLGFGFDNRTETNMKAYTNKWKLWFCELGTISEVICCDKRLSVSISLTTSLDFVALQGLVMQSDLPVSSLLDRNMRVVNSRDKHNNNIFGVQKISVQ